jgi:hypothetical protein
MVNVSTEALVPCRADRARIRLDATLGAALTDRHEQGRTTVSHLRSAPLRRLDRIYPAFDGRVAVTAIDDTSCLLTIAGTYEPPFGRVGAVLDRTVMHGVAASTAAEFAHRLSRALAHDAEEGLS